MSDLLRRDDALAKTRAKYMGRELDWRAHMTCVHMARYHLRAMGHRPARIPAFRSPTGAVRALRKNGWANCADMLDAQLLPRIAPAAMLPGDMMLAKSDDDAGDTLGAIGICVGNKIMGWRLCEETGLYLCNDLIVTEFEGAWRL